MRQVVLDTETTGLSVAEGHRIIEIGCVEMIDRRITDNYFHQYLQPDRDIDVGALEVHGITAEFLKDKPRFCDIAGGFLDYINGAELIIHNAPFDIGFLDNELGLLTEDRGSLGDYCSVIDTLVLARQMHPGQRNTLDALCKRYEIDNSCRELHGALLDSQILSDVYLAMTGGQAALRLDTVEKDSKHSQKSIKRLNPLGYSLKVIKANDKDLQAHDDYLKLIEKESGATPVWLRNSY